VAHFVSLQRIVDRNRHHFQQGDISMAGRKELQLSIDKINNGF
jgi:hypothetical protein